MKFDNRQVEILPMYIESRVANEEQPHFLLICVDPFKQSRCQLIY